MKKIILGSIVYILFWTNVYANINAFVDKVEFYPGDSVRLTISANGASVQLPDIATIGQYPVTSVSNASSISVVNGKQNQQLSKSYTFKPGGSMTIPSFSVTIAGKNHQTKPIAITQIIPSASKTGDNFVLEMKLPKQDFFVGEKGTLSVIFKAKKSLGDFGSVNINPVNSQGVEFITDHKFIKTTHNDYTIFTLHYEFRAYEFGELVIPSIFATISNSSGFGVFQTRSVVQKVYSHPLTLNVAPLPDNLILYGDFAIAMNVDATKANEGEAVNAELKITGKGNIEDIEAFKLDIPNATIYSDNPQVNDNMFIQKFAIVGQSDFSIPSMQLEFFDSTTQAKKIITTQAYNITILENNKVKHNALTASIPISTSSTTSSTSPASSTLNTATHTITKVKNDETYYLLIVGIGIGISIGLLIAGIWWYIRSIGTSKHSKFGTIITQVRLAKNHKELFAILAPLDIVEMSEILQKLEQNIYKNTTNIKHKISKKEIIKILNKV
jgi:hypothetical protein